MRISGQQPTAVQSTERITLFYQKIVNNHSNNKNQFRIIAGKWRSRKLSFPGSISTLRPTTDRIKETVFNWLQMDLPGANCLDLFAGSGALSFEASSRLAESVTCIDSSPDATNRIKENCELLQCDNINVIKADALQWLSRQSDQYQFDIVFVDPPFSENMLDQCVQLLESGNCLAPDALIYIESGASLDDLEVPDEWEQLKNSKAGQVYFGVYKRIIR